MREHAEQRRRVVEFTLTEPALALLRRLSRPATTEEKVLVSEVPVEILQAKLDERTALVRVRDDARRLHLSVCVGAFEVRTSALKHPRRVRLRPGSVLMVGI